jgi:hypothetical protein
LAAERNLVTARRADGAIGIATTELDALAAELKGAGSADCQPIEAQTVGRSLVMGGGQHPQSASDLPASSASDISTPAPAAAPPGPIAEAAGDGQLAASVFQELAAGKTLGEIVVSLRIAPEIARDLHLRWKALELVDGLTTESAEDRLTRLDQLVDGVGARLDRRAELDNRLFADLLRRLDGLHGRLGALEQRLAGDGTRQLARNLEQRLLHLEGRLKGMPTDLIAINHRCDWCGLGPMVIPAACARCGRGIPPPSEPSPTT